MDFYSVYHEVDATQGMFQEERGKSDEDGKILVDCDVKSRELSIIGRLTPWCLFDQLAKFSLDLLND